MNMTTAYITFSAVLLFVSSLVLSITSLSVDLTAMIAPTDLYAPVTEVEASELYWSSTSFDVINTVSPEMHTVPTESEAKGLYWNSISF